VAISEYRYRRRVQFAETDMAGVVHFANFLRYMEEAEHALWREAGLSIVPPESEIGFPRVAASIEFHAPLYFEDEFEVHIRVAALSRRSIRYTSLITRAETRIASGTVTAVCVRNTPRPMRAIDLPDDIARRFAVADPA
jgi:YbgC/YbaW family acyl-CoA thioester hydrolase